MKLNLVSKFAGLLVLTAVIAFSSCKKDASVNQSKDTPAAIAAKDATQDDAVAEAQYDEVFNITMGVQASDAGEDIGIGTGVDVIYQNRTNADGTSAVQTPVPAPCFSISVVPNTRHVFPKTVTIDFGSGCMGRDGKLRKGKIISIYTGPMFIPGSKCSTTFEGYYVDSFKIEGKYSVENTSTSNQKQWTVHVADGKIINTNISTWKLWSSIKTHTQVEGNGTPSYPLDDVFQITGSATGSSSNGNSWTALITEPLVKKIG
ncbi:MAG: hypothetical protein ABIO76_12145, partial [Ginsengibacter sp.]